MASDWNPGLYLKFGDERSRPARDLLAQAPLTNPRIIYDLGCGPGNSTELLARRFPEARITGVDNSPAMLKEARAALPAARFVEADLAHWMPEERPDLLFSNATFQWVPDHLKVLTRLMGTLAPEGVFAVQMPDNMGEPSHALMRETSKDGPWAEKLAKAARPPLPPVRDYYNALKPLAARVDIWRTAYNHPLKGAEGIVEMVSSTGLRPFLAPLTEAEQAAFRAQYTARIAKAYPPNVDGTVLLSFPRLFIVAQL
ncbi:trans-aconitate 2-methyltransferase [Aestuariivirga sp.]|uniref:trans-aconitate 2-methyltransferase n=1 Tax=Aestuariivirga sp. TaxID=2650926 RepID=UPI0039E6954A